MNSSKKSDLLYLFRWTHQKNAVKVLTFFFTKINNPSKKIQKNPNFLVDLSSFLLHKKVRLFWEIFLCSKNGKDIQKNYPEKSPK